MSAEAVTRKRGPPTQEDARREGRRCVRNRNQEEEKTASQRREPGRSQERAIQGVVFRTKASVKEDESL